MTTPKPRVKIATAEEVKPQPRLKRSDSLTGLNSLHKGVNELETIVSGQRDALNQCFEQIERQDALLKKQEDHLNRQDAIIKMYEEQLTELDLVIDRIIES